MKCLRPYCNGTVLGGKCLLCCRAPEGTTPEPLQMPVNHGGAGRSGDGIITEASRELVGWLLQNPGRTTSELAADLEVRVRTMEGRVSSLYGRGVLVREGDGGMVSPYRWYVVEDVEEASE
jgi:predicted HTH transcriptional regulator